MTRKKNARASRSTYCRTIGDCCLRQCAAPRRSRCSLVRTGSLEQRRGARKQSRYPDKARRDRLHETEKDRESRRVPYRGGACCSLVEVGRGVGGPSFEEPCPPHLVTPRLSGFHRDAALSLVGTSCSCAGSLTPHRGFGSADGPVFTCGAPWSRVPRFLASGRIGSRRVHRHTGHMRHETGLMRVRSFITKRYELRSILVFCRYTKDRHLSTVLFECRCAD